MTEVISDPAILRENAKNPGWYPGRKVCIVGFTLSKEEAPFDDPSWDIRGCNNLYRPELWGGEQKRFTRIYDPHSVEEIRSDPHHEAWIKAGSTPVYVTDPQPDWPSAIRIPRDELNNTPYPYYTNTISWMIAHALYEGPPEELWLIGVDMAQGTEYAQQRPSCEYFLGLAQGMGVKVYVPKTSDLLKSAFQYGFENDSPLRTKLEVRQREVTQRRAEVQAALANVEARKEATLKQLQAEREQLIHGDGQCQGVLEQIAYEKAVWLNANTQNGIELERRPDASNSVLPQSDGERAGELHLVKE